MSTFNELVSLLEDYGFADTSTVRKEEVLNDAMWEIEADGPWRYQQKEATVALAASNRTPTMPSNFQIAVSFTIPSLPVRLWPEEYDYMAKSYSDLTTEGQPFFYYFIGTTCNIYPVPSATYTAQLMYLISQPKLTAGAAESAILLPAKHHRLIALKALSNLYAMEDDVDLSRVFAGFYQAKLEKVRADLAQVQIDMPQRIYDVYGSDEYWTEF